MKTSKKILLFVFTIVLVLNLQLSGTITAGMENGFSIEQLADNIFVPSAFAFDCDDLTGCKGSASCDGDVTVAIGAPICRAQCEDGSGFECPVE